MHSVAPFFVHIADHMRKEQLFFVHVFKKSRRLTAAVGVLRTWNSCLSFYCFIALCTFEQNKFDGSNTRNTR